MKFNLRQVLESKRALRRNLASRPVAAKLALLDVLRDRTIAIRDAATNRESTFARQLIEENRPLFEESSVHRS